MPGSTEKHIPGRTGCVSPSTMYGGSWVVIPMPCPVRWMKNSPKPASVMTARAARSTSWHSIPGWTASHPACCARQTISCTSRSSSVGSPTCTVRVVSDPYPYFSPPKSSTTMSPSSMTRSPISWWGFAPLGPDPTTVKSTCECPNRRSRPARSAATSVSRRPANRTWRISSYARSAAAAAAASRSTSAASLMARSIGRPLVSDT